MRSGSGIASLLMPAVLHAVGLMDFCVAAGEMKSLRSAAVFRIFLLCVRGHELAT